MLLWTSTSEKVLDSSEKCSVSSKDCHFLQLLRQASEVVRYIYEVKIICWIQDFNGVLFK